MCSLSTYQAYFFIEPLRESCVIRPCRYSSVYLKNRIFSYMIIVYLLTSVNSPLMQYFLICILFCLLTERYNLIVHFPPFEDAGLESD